MKHLFIIVFGNACVGGLTHCGPFESQDAAADWAAANERGIHSEWIVLPLKQPVVAAVKSPAA